MNERQAQQTIMCDLYRRSFVLPNYRPRKWWECDVFCITAAGYFREYEVKLTLSDFRADRRKESRPWRLGERSGWGRPSVRKHQLLAQGDPRGPVQFWYVTPPGLIGTKPGDDRNPEAPLPPWAGLIEIQARHGRLWADEIRKAPRLHNHKFDDQRAAHARSVTYWRMHHALQSFVRPSAEGETE